jgi:putative methyltransferase (TIGR04325 family)
VLHHLGRLLKPGGRVFDLGGNVGNHYYLYRHHLPLGEVSWTVGEVKAIAAIGAAIAAEQGAKNLAFTSELAGMGGHDVLVCQGSIQYFKAFPPEDAKAFPPALLVNRQPLTRGSTFVTMQNGGEGIFYPQRIYNQDEFRALLKSLGYRIVDEWPDPDDEIMLPFHRRAVEYRGCYAARD